MCFLGGKAGPQPKEKRSGTDRVVQVPAMPVRGDGDRLSEEAEQVSQ